MHFASAASHDTDEAVEFPSMDSSSFIADLNHPVYLLRAEAQRSVARKVGSDIDRGVLHIVFMRLQAAGILRGLHQHVGYIVHLVIIAGHVEFHTDDDIRARRLGHIHRVVVLRAAVGENHRIDTHRPEVAWNRHSGTQGLDKVSFGPVLLRLSHNLRGNAAERSGQIEEVEITLVTYRHGTHQIVDVQPVFETGGQTFLKPFLIEREVEDIG